MSLLAQVAQAEPGSIGAPEVQWSALVPLLILSVGGVLMLTVSSLVRRAPKHAYALATAAIALAAGVAIVILWRDFDSASLTLTGSFSVDKFTLFTSGLICASVFLTALLADDYLRREGLEGPELYVLMLMSASGGVVMAAAADLIVLFIGLEVLSIAVYVLAAMHLRRVQSQEAGLKYFVLGAFSSAFFLYGIAFIYGATGTIKLAGIRAFLGNDPDVSLLLENGLLLTGMGLLLVGLGFKVAAVPFHSWTPDVYEGAPSPAVAFMASAVKVAAFAALLRIFVGSLGSQINEWQLPMMALAVASLVLGSLLAVVQTNVKRMLAYSSISHAGFILVGVSTGTADGWFATLFYLFAYTFMVIGSFGVITLAGGEGDAKHSLDDYRGLARRQPVLGFAFAIFLLAQAGVPLTTGFVGKLEVILAAAEADLFWLAIVAMVSAVVAAYLYLRIVVAVFLEDEDPDAVAAEAATVEYPVTAMVAIGVALAVTVAFGVFPGEIDDLARQALPFLAT